MEPLDQSLLKKREIVSNQFGSVYSNLGVTVLLVALCVMGLISILNFDSRSIVGIILGLIGAAGLTFTYGTDVDLNNQQYREYTSVLFIKSGKWKSMQLYPFITVLKNNESFIVYSNLIQTTNNPGDEFGIYILNNTHYQKILLEKSDSFSLAKSRLEFYANRLQKQITEYKPLKISNRR